MHYKKDVPGEGILDIRWSGEKISAFLRAMDYAGLGVFEKPVLYYGGKVFQWKKYEVQTAKNENGKSQKVGRQTVLFLDGDNIVISKGNYHVVLKDYVVVEDGNEALFAEKLASSEKSPAS